MQEIYQIVMFVVFCMVVFRKPHQTKEESHAQDEDQ